MKTIEIIEEWRKDAIIDKTELDNESLKIPYLHGKYWKFYIDEKRKLVKFQQDMKKMVQVKKEYYQGLLSKEELDAFGWEPFPLKVIKQDLQTYIDSDNDIIKRNIRISEQTEKVELIRDIIKALHNRGFQLKTAMDFLKFSAGLG